MIRRPGAAPRICLIPLLLAMAACAAPEKASTVEEPEPGLNVADLSPDELFTIGDIDPFEPARRIRRIQPFADYVAARMSDLGIRAGHVIVARSIEEMAGLIRSGQVDLFSDSVYPILAIEEMTGSRVILRRWVGEVGEYWSVVVVRRDSGISSLDELNGRLIAFDEPHSTSGFFLPALKLKSHGLDLRESTSDSLGSDPGALQYVFSRDEENTVEMVVSGTVDAAAIANTDFDLIPADRREKLMILDRTMAVPRQLVAVRPDLPEEHLARIKKILEDVTDEDRAALDKKVTRVNPWTWRFAELGDEFEEPLATLRLSIMKRSSGDE